MFFFEMGKLNIEIAIITGKRRFMMSEENKNRNKDKGKQNNKNQHEKLGHTVEFSEETVFNADKKRGKKHSRKNK